jgi:hypothetical protein
MNHGITQRGGSSDRSSVRIRASPAAQTGRRHKPRFWLLWLAQAIKSIPPIQSEHMQPRPHHRLVLVLLLCSVVLRRRHHCRRSYPRHEPRSRSLARARARVCWFLSIDRSIVRFFFCFFAELAAMCCVMPGRSETPRTVQLLPQLITITHWLWGTSYQLFDLNKSPFISCIAWTFLACMAHV